MNNTGPLALSALALMLTLPLLWLAYQVFIRPHRRTFEDKGVRFELAPGEGVVHITTSQDAKPATLKFGCGAFQFDRLTYEETRQKWFDGTPGSVSTYTSSNGFTFGEISAPTQGRYIDVTESRSTGTTCIILHELDPIPYFYSKWATHPETNRVPSARLVLDITLGNWAARVLKWWVYAHRRQLVPSESAYRKAWDGKCKRLLDACRQAPAVRSLRKPLELYDFDNEPSIRYLAIDKEGAACFRGCGIAAHEVDFDDLMAQGMTVTVPLPDGRQATFAMKEAQVASLHKIRSRWQKRQRMHG